MKVPQEFFVTTIKEVSDKNFGIGGKTLDKVKEPSIVFHKYVNKSLGIVDNSFRGYVV